MAPLSWWQKGYNLLVEIQTLHRMNRFREAEMKVRKEDRARGRTLHEEEPGRGQSVKKKKEKLWQGSISKEAKKEKMQLLTWLPHHFLCPTCTNTKKTGTKN